MSECSGCEHSSDQGSDQFFHEILTEIEVINQVTRSMSQQGKRIVNNSVDTQIEKIESSPPISCPTMMIDRKHDRITTINVREWVRLTWLTKG